MPFKIKTPLKAWFNLGQHIGTALSNSKFLQFQVTKYNINTGTATELASYPFKVVKHACVADDKFIYVTGGKTIERKNPYPSRQVAVYDLAADTWSTDQIPKLSYIAVEHAMVIFRGLLTVIGGRGGYGSSRSSRRIQIYKESKWYDWEITNIRRKSFLDGAAVILP